MTGMNETELLEVWEDGASRRIWEKVRAKASAKSDDKLVAMAAAKLEGLPQPLQALAANVDLVRQLVGTRWQVILLAREGGASWAEVAEALQVTVEEARGSYAAAIDRQERYVGDLHDAARARAVLGDDQPPAGGERP